MPRYAIEIGPAAAREIRKLPSDIRHRIVRLIDGLATDPRPNGVKKLAGSEDLYRVRTGDYRVLYQTHDAVLLVLVVTVGNRRDVYR